MDLDTITQMAAERLRYRNVPSIIGQKVRINRLSTIEGDVQQALKEVLSLQCEPVEKNYGHAGAIWKLGLITLDFAVSDTTLATEYETGLDLLRKLNFIDAERGWADDRVDDPTCLTDLLEDLTLGKTFFIIELVTDKRPKRPKGIKGPSVPLPVDYFPCSFTVKRACFANSTLVWVNTYGIGVTWL